MTRKNNDRSGKAAGSRSGKAAGGKRTEAIPAVPAAGPSTGSWNDRPELAPHRESTLQQYRKVSARVVRLAAKSMALDIDQVSLPMAADWLIRHRPDYKPGTFDLYRSGMLWLMSIEGFSGAEMEHLRAAGNQPCRRSSKGGPAVKAKGVSPEDLEKLLDYLDGLKINPRSQIGFAGIKTCSITRAWLLAGLATGLRPCEWQDARIVGSGDAQTLIAKNAKVLFTAAGEQWRGNGIERSLSLGGMPREDLDAIRKTLDILKQASAEGEFAHLHDLCGRVLRRANIALWPRRLTHVTLYTTRHQYTADAKASGRAPDEIAAALGHRATATAARHYGKRSKGAVRVLPRPAPDAVTTVRGRKGLTESALATPDASPLRKTLSGRPDVR